jgi:hypothetical protein
MDQARAPLVLPTITRVLPAAALAAIGNELLAFATVASGGAPPSFEPLRPGGATISTVVAALGAALVLAAARRWSSRPVRVFLLVAIAVLALSYVPVIALARDPSAIPGATPAAIAALGAMHVVAFAIVVPWLLRGGRSS